MKKLIATLIISVIVGFIALYFNGFSLGSVIDYDITEGKDLLVLYNEANGEDVVLLKTDDNGNIDFKKNITLIDGDYFDIYHSMIIDAKGNIFFKIEKFDTTSTLEGRASWSLLSERVDMYDFEGNFKGTVLSFKNDGLSKDNTIVKIQDIDNEIYAFCRNKQQYYIVKATTLGSSGYTVERNFTLDKELYLKSDAAYINDIALTSDKRIVYSTNNGAIFIEQKDGSWIDISQKVHKKALIKYFSLDGKDNIYFTDETNGIFYKYNIKTDSIEQLYTSESKITDKIKFSDIKNVKATQEGQYKSISINAVDWFFLGFGNDVIDIDSIYKPIDENAITFAKGFFISLLVVGAVIQIISVAKYRLALKIIFAFVPVYLIATSIFGSIIVDDNMETYTDDLYKLLQAGAKVVGEYIPESKFRNYDYVDGYMQQDFTEIKLALEKGILYVNNNLYDMAQGYMVVYAIQNDRIYSTFTTDLSEVRDRQAGSRPVEYIASKETVEKMYFLLDQARKNPDTLNNVLKLQNRDYIGTWIGAVVPLRNSNGEVMGFIESGVNKANTYDLVFQKTFKKLMAVLSIITIFVFFYFLLLIRHCLSPHKDLGLTMQEIAKGRWSSKVKVKTSDEIGDIGNAFNLMTSRLSEYISNFMDLNRAYVKFIPNELIHLLGKKDILEVELFNHDVREMSMLFVNFNLTANKQISMNSTDYFNLMNQNFDTLFEIAGQNHGIIERFDGMGMLILFENDVENAIKTSIQFREALGDVSIINQTLRTIISFGETLIGVAGNKDRNSITTVSNEVTQIYSINNYMDRLDMRYVITEDAVKKISSNSFHYRFVGNVRHVSKPNPTGIYQQISGTLYLETKAGFENGVKCYIDKNFISARKHFVDVLRINEKDKIAMHYLALCDNPTQNGTLLD